MCKECSHSNECRNYNPSAPLCNEEYQEKRCGISRNWESYLYDDEINPYKA